MLEHTLYLRISNKLRHRNITITEIYLVYVLHNGIPENHLTYDLNESGRRRSDHSTYLLPITPLLIIQAQ